jgi:hypothetical protein
MAISPSTIPTSRHESGKSDCVSNFLMRDEICSIEANQSAKALADWQLQCSPLFSRIPPTYKYLIGAPPSNFADDTIVDWVLQIP